MNVLARPLLIFAVVYFITLGATFNGILMPDIRLLSTLILGAGIGLWALRKRALADLGTPLDGALLLWMVGFLLSWAFNGDLSHRILLGLWFMAVYIVVWIILNSLIASRPSLRLALANGLLIAGGLVILVGLAQIQRWLIELPLALTSGQPLILPRPGSLIGNPNALAAFLLMTFPLAAIRITERQPLIRVLSALYVITALLLIVLTYSRGAWIGTAAAIAIFPVMAVYGRSPRQIWQDASSKLRTLITIGLIAILVAAAAFSVLMVRTLSVTGRSAELRTYLWDAALRMLEGSPVVGQGLFTFGHELARYSSIPPQQAQAHAHNVVFHISAELGMVGLVALILTVVLALRAWRRNWQEVNASGMRSDRRLMIGATASFGGFFVHHLLDMPAMMPAIALTAITVLAIAIAPFRATARAGIMWRFRHVHAAVALGLIVVVIGAAVLNSLRYREYVARLSAGVGNADYSAAAASLAGEPGVAARIQQGMLHALADEPEAAYAAYAAALSVEPLWAFAHANAGMLALTSGEADQAVQHLQTAAALAPAEGWYSFWMAQAAEAAGDLALARSAAESALLVNSGLRFLPAWGTSPLFADAVGVLPQDTLESADRIVLVLDAIAEGQGELARELWGAESTDSAFQSSFSAMVASAAGETARGAQLLSIAGQQATTPSDRAWFAYATAEHLRLQGRSVEAAQVLDTVRSLISGGPVSSDWESGANIFYLQLYTTSIPRMMVPQAGYTPVDPLLVRIMALSDEAGP